VTARHVLDGAIRARLRFSNGEEFESTGLIDSDVARDVALIRVRTFGRPLLAFATIEPQVGSRALLIGSPRGLEFTVTDGLISQFRIEAGMRYIQFTCPASKGNSGGPLFGEDGSVIGIVSWQLTEGQNLNFAIPMSYVLGLDSTLPTTPWDHVAATPAARSTETRTTSPPEPASGRPAPPTLESAIVPQTLITAKTAFVGYLSGHHGVFENLPKKLKEWGRFTLVEQESEADVILVLAQGNDFEELLLIAYDRSHRRLTSVSCQRRMGAAYTAGVLANRLKNRIADAEKRR